jgi:hypothetical protein
MNSSASNATATEKTSPATTAINVIAICIQGSSLSFANPLADLVSQDEYQSSSN